LDGAAASLCCIKSSRNLLCHTALPAAILKSFACSPHWILEGSFNQLLEPSQISLSGWLAEAIDKGNQQTKQKIDPRVVDFDSLLKQSSFLAG
jgi:hypothetical protein